MSAVSAPYGLRAAKRLDSLPFAGAIREIAMTVNSATGIFYGDLIAVNGGQPSASAATPTTARDGNTPVGICVGIRYTDATLKQEQHTQFLPANAITGGATKVFIKVVDDPNVLFTVQANGSVPLSAIGKNAGLTNFGQGSTATGNSKIQLDAASIAVTATLAVRIVDISAMAGNAAGDAFTDVLVKFNQGVHAYQNATGA